MGKRKSISIISGIIVFVGLFLAQKFFYVLNETIDKDWNRREIAYPVKWDFVQSIFLAKLRADLLKDGYSEDNILLTVLNKWHLRVYESALEKIPSTDPIRVMFWRQYKYVPIVVADGNERSILNEINQNYKFLAEHKSQSEYFENIDKLVFMSDFISSYSSVTRQIDLSETDQKYLSEALNTLKKADIEYILSSLKPETIFGYIASIQGLTYELFFQRLPQKNCPDFIAKGWVESRDFGVNLLKKSFEQKYSSKVQKYIQQIQDNLDYAPSKILSLYPDCSKIIKEF